MINLIHESNLCDVPAGARHLSAPAGARARVQTVGVACAPSCAAGDVI
jgi:hypothetical protein